MRTASIAAARAMGEEDIWQTCERILADEEEMASWLDENMARTARESVTKE